MPGKRTPFAPLLLALTALVALPSVAPAAERAFVTNSGEGTISVIDAASEEVTGEIEVCTQPEGIAMTPDGSAAYVACREDNLVYPIDTAAMTAGAPIEVGVGKGPWSVAVTPDGQRAYVSNLYDESVSVIDTETNELAGPDIAVGESPAGLAVSPDGSTVYVPNAAGLSNSISVIDTAAGEVGEVVETIPVGAGTSPQEVAFAPGGAQALVTNRFSGDVRVVDTEKEEVVGTPIEVGNQPKSIAITADGRAFVANENDDTVSEIEIESEGGTVLDTTEVGDFPRGIAIRPDGERGYVVNYGDGNVSVLDTSSGVSSTVVSFAGGGPGGSGPGGVGASGVTSAPITVGSAPVGVAFTEVPAAGEEEGPAEEPEEETPSEEEGPGEEGGSSEGGSSEGGGAGASSAGSSPGASGSAGSGGASSGGSSDAGTGDGVPPPVLGESVSVEPAKGVVKTKCRGQKRFAPLSAGASIPLGCFVDTRRGTVVLTSAAGGGTQTAKFWNGLFRVGQTRGRRPYTTLALSGPLGCGGKRRNSRRHGSRRGSRHGSRRGSRRGAGHRAQTSRRRHKKGRHGGGRSLWGSGKGRFRTKGRYGSASVRGTIWLVADRCDNSTLFRVRRGVVRVHDDARGRNLNLRAGRSYVARPGHAGRHRR